jgi:predicted metal-dependent HD superfamily phosphohydrolase
MDAISSDPGQLRTEWFATIGAFGVCEAHAKAAFVDLVTRYSTPGRFYHNMDHIAEVLAAISGLRELAHQYPVIQVAAWYHDVVYDSTAKDNEERSAAHAAESLSSLRLPAPTIHTVQDLILRTKTHQPAPEDPDAQILLDADLARLGANEERYWSYARAIRQEYAWVPEQEYRAGRRMVLEGFLQRERLFWAAPVWSSLERQARRNLSQEILALT